MTPDATQWQISGDYFENCNCDVVCPCLFSAAAPLTSRPTAGACDVGIGFHIDRGKFSDVPLDDMIVALMIHTPGAMSDGNWSVVAYLDERASQAQQQALHAIFTGSAGGPLSVLAPLISTIVGMKLVPMTFRKEGRTRSLEIAGAGRIAVHAAPSLVPDQEIWASNAHPFNTDGVALAVGDADSSWADFGMQWDNSGKNGHYAPINWSNV